MQNGSSQVDYNSSVVVPMKELPQEVQELCGQSLKARNVSYAPYSKYNVGAALKSAVSDDVFIGCNVENASYGLSLCAERTALVKAVSGGCREFSSIAIAVSDKTHLAAPCGACRQFMCEFNPNMVIYLVREIDHHVQVTNLNKLLPQCFSPKTMNFEFLSNGH